MFKATPLQTSGLKVAKRSVLLLGAGFEDRVTRAVEVFEALNQNFEHILIAQYSDEKNSKNEIVLNEKIRAILSRNGSSTPLPIQKPTEYREILLRSISDTSHVYVDISGLNTEILFQTLEILHSKKIAFSVIYTEAQEYHPTQDEFDQFVSLANPESDIENLRDYELSDLVYSSNCSVEILEGFEGNISPGYPYFLIAFLPFKRARLGVLLEQISASERQLIVGQPLRSDLRWRAELLKRVHFDLINDGASKLHSLCTLDAYACLDFLEELYNNEEQQIKYRYNFVLAPLGSKMQKIACWAFGRRNPNICIVASNPVTTFSDYYSKGFGETFLLSDAHNLVGDHHDN